MRTLTYLELFLVDLINVAVAFVPSKLLINDPTIDCFTMSTNLLQHDATTTTTFKSMIHIQGNFLYLHTIPRRTRSLIKVPSKTKRKVRRGFTVPHVPFRVSKRDEQFGVYRLFKFKPTGVSEHRGLNNAICYRNI
ncbi:uncharacterized protein LOC143357933 [Halictus rubicundus]|uniref:uncharacterized protein LOC143357933 n=1 Tax=Halictus rubicundus TaxID=77578 RepID=UPI0040359A70